MGLMDFAKKQFLDIIEWKNQEDDIIVYNYHIKDNEIQDGSRLVVRPGQKAIFLNQGMIANVFEEGTYELTPGNVALWTDLKNWKFGFESFIKSDIIFVATKEFLDVKWGTKSPILIPDPKFEQVEIRAFGNFGFSAPQEETILRTLVGSKRKLRVDDVKEIFNAYINRNFATIVGKSGLSVAEYAQNYEVIAQTLINDLHDEFQRIGFELTELNVINISLPEELQATLRKRTQVNMMGGITGYGQVAAIDAMKDAAQNGNSFAGMGMGISAGMQVGQQFANYNPTQNGQPPVQFFDPKQQNQQKPNENNNVPTNNNINSTEKATNPISADYHCAKCGNVMGADMKFCPKCGTPKPEKKFCSNCGTESSEGNAFCFKCGNKL